MRSRNRVDARQRVHIGKGRQQVAVGRHVGADVGQRSHAQPQDAPVGVEGDLGIADVVAGVFVGQHGFAALAGPFHGPAQLARRPGNQAVFRVLPALGAKAAAHVIGDHADPMLRNLEDVFGQCVAHPMRVLHVGPDRVSLVAFVVAGQHAARLHVVRIDPADHIAAADHMRGLGERLFGGLGIARFEHIGDVVGAFVPDGGRSRRDGLCRVGHRGQRLIVDLEALGRILGLPHRFGHHQRHRIADVADPAASQPGMRTREQGRAVRSLARQVDFHRAQSVARHVVAGVDSQHARRLQCRLQIDRADMGVGVRRTNQHRVGLPGQIDVVDKAAAAAQQSRILEA